MILPSPLIRGRLVRRYKRFFADVEMPDGSVVTAHCPNTGAMLGVATPGSAVWLSRSDNPKRKLPYTWELVRSPDAPESSLVGINPMNANRIVAGALEGGDIALLRDYGTVRPEVRYGHGSRVDFLLTQTGLPDCYVEVKNVHLMREPGLAEFPDAVTSRATKHLGELAAETASGNRALMLFLVQRADCDRFAVADDIDPAYGAALDSAVAAGVEVLCLACRVRLTDITVVRTIDFDGTKRRRTP
ncbi:MAG: DNA/RNA nuclease SfsA [Proteobacteria bacterium]|nr:DNA/RNA nuclease SfsA [Pseudomonadota bacterium]MDA1057131.1 DNA/RNA nuclease SfsA [Pseudomonadota bacterium]